MFLFPSLTRSKGEENGTGFSVFSRQVFRRFFCKSAFYHQREITVSNLTPLSLPLWRPIYRTQGCSSFKETSSIADGRAKKEGRRAQPISANQVPRRQENKNKLRAPPRATRPRAVTRSAHTWGTDAVGRDTEWGGQLRIHLCLARNCAMHTCLAQALHTDAAVRCTHRHSIAPPTPFRCPAPPIPQRPPPCPRPPTPPPLTAHLPCAAAGCPAGPGHQHPMAGRRRRGSSAALQHRAGPMSGAAAAAGAGGLMSPWRGRCGAGGGCVCGGGG